MPSPPPPSMSTLHQCCSSPSPSPSPPKLPPPPRLQRAPDSKRNPPRCSRVSLNSRWRVPPRNSAGGGARLPPTTRRAHAASLLLLGLAAVSAPAPAPARAEEDGSGGEEEGVLGAIKSIFDPNEKTKAGKTLPKAYLKAAREVVRTLRESLEEDDGGDMARFRRNADAAKESIREFLGGWRGQQAVAAEESYVALEKAIRSLAEFYSKAGPSASLPQDVKNKILDDLSTADAYL